MHWSNANAAPAVFTAAFLPFAWPALFQDVASGGSREGVDDHAGENASTPLAKVRNTDLWRRHLELRDGNNLNDLFVHGTVMATDKLKIEHALHHWETKVTGRSENDY